MTITILKKLINTEDTKAMESFDKPLQEVSLQNESQTLENDKIQRCYEETGAFSQAFDEAPSFK